MSRIIILFLKENFFWDTFSLSGVVEDFDLSELKRLISKLLNWILWNVEVSGVNRSNEVLRIILSKKCEPRI